MQELLEILKYTLPSLIVFLSAYFVLKTFLRNEKEKRLSQIKSESQKLITPIRLQAYERIVLFLERITAESLALRTQRQGMTVQQLRGQMIATIRAEFEHNLSQQLYVSPQAWKVVKTARESMTRLINTAADGIDPKAKAFELSKNLLELQVSITDPPIETAIAFLKTEMSEFF